MATLSGTFLDLVTDGVPNPVDRSSVVIAVRSVMLSAHRGKVPFPQVQDLLSDTENRRLAKQLATGRGGRQMTSAQRSRFLRSLWQQTGEIAAQRPAWDRDVALAAIEHVRDHWAGTEALPSRHKAIVDVALDLATEHGTTRPTVPVREVEKRTGIPYQSVSRILGKISAEGTWLKLAKRGNHRTGRASLYTLAPDLLRDFTDNVWGASPPESHPEPMSQPPMSQEEEPMSMSITVTAANEEDLRRAIQALTNPDPHEARRLISDSAFPLLRLVASGE
jgi:hypothetical protein